MDPTPYTILKLEKTVINNVCIHDKKSMLRLLIVLLLDDLLSQFRRYAKVTGQKQTEKHN